jgi:choline dehydrogenase-like flavoprotein
MRPRGVGAYLGSDSGMLTSNIAEAGGFLTSRPGLERPDLQLHFTIGLVADHGRDRKPRYGFSCHVCVLRPRSRGSVGLSSPDPLAPPRIDPAFLADDEDAALLQRGVKMTLEILGQRALDGLRGANVFGEEGRSDDALMDLIRRRADTIYHPVGTCRMRTDDLAVVDSQLRVRGIERLRVADASVMPSLIGGNTNASVMMIGERAADFISAAGRLQAPARRADTTRGLQPALLRDPACFSVPETLVSVCCYFRNLSGPLSRRIVRKRMLCPLSGNSSHID